MRLIPVVALVSSALALAACAGGETLGTNSLSVGPECEFYVDGIKDKCGDDTPPPPPPLPDSDGDGIPDKDDTDGGTGSGAGGNNTNLNSTTGTRAIVLKSAIYDAPSANDIAYAAITSGNLTADATRDAILSVNKPTTLKIRVDTNSQSNSQLAVPIEMPEFIEGTRDLRWLMLGHSTLEPEDIAAGVIDTNGQPLIYDRTIQKFRHSAADTVNGKYRAGDVVNESQEYYWNQIYGFMDDRANGGAGADYREYRIKSSKLARDELMQVWAWGDSYAAHYQNRTGGGTPKHQAWTFGGRKSTAIPKAGLATYKGRFVATAKSSNWINPDDSDIDFNVDWRVQGASELTADFDRSAMKGILTPESWSSYQSKLKAWYTWNTSAADNGAMSGDNPSVGTLAAPDFIPIYGTKVEVDGTIAADGSYSGSAKLVNDFSAYVTDDNSFQGDFFGTTETTGVFTAAGTSPSPVGGSDGITTNKDGNLSITGAFNANCRPNFTCVIP